MYFFCLRFACRIQKFQKYLLSQEIAETPRLMWRNPFRHWSTQRSISSQIDQNAPSQPYVDRKSKLVKIILKQHFSCFYIKPNRLGDFRQLWPSLTWGWLSGPSERVETSTIAKIIEFLFQRLLCMLACFYALCPYFLL